MKLKGKINLTKGIKNMIKLKKNNISQIEIEGYD